MSIKRPREESSWCTIESDPGIFTLLIEKLGVKGVQVEEIYDLESADVPPALGFIFLFKWSKECGTDGNPIEDEDVFFAQQEISNACATLAILHILLNSSVELGQVLENFKAFSQELPADMRGLCLSNSLEIRQIHNEFGNLTELLAFGEDEDELEKDPKAKDPFHFVAFIQRNGKIYELDGLKDSPILHAKTDGASTWQAEVLGIIKKRAESGEIRFNLMALCPDRREALKTEISELTAAIEEEKRTSWLTRRFQAQQELDEEEAKWSRYRKEWTGRQREYREASHQPKALKDTKLGTISPQVQDLLKSMAVKGLIPK